MCTRKRSRRTRSRHQTRRWIRLAGPRADHRASRSKKRGPPGWSGSPPPPSSPPLPSMYLHRLQGPLELTATRDRAGSGDMGGSISEPIRLACSGLCVVRSIAATDVLVAEIFMCNLKDGSDDTRILRNYTVSSRWDM